MVEFLKDSTVAFLSVPRELKLRNYTPEDEELKQRKVPNAKPASGKQLLGHQPPSDRRNKPWHNSSAIFYFAMAYC